MQKVDWTKLLICVVGCIVIGSAGALFTSTGDWFASLNKPSFNPPSWVFGPVWTLLYAMMGLAAYRVWQTPPTGDRKIALGSFLLQLAINVAWTPVFFGLHQMAIAVMVIVILWLAILFTIVAFSRLDRTAAWLLIPYILWVTFATFLNASFVMLNPPTSA